jgi:glucose/arabinose dehydrogenase
VNRHPLAIATATALLVAGCGKGAQLPESAGYGPDPTIPAPDYAVVAPIEIPKPLGWRDGRMPIAAPGLAVTAFAAGLVHPRWLQPLPDGGLLVAESDGPAEPVKRPKDVVMQFMMKRAKAGVTPPNRISLLRDLDGDGRAESRVTFIAGLEAPFGMALVGNDLYVADTSALLRYRYRPGADRPEGVPEKIAALPGGPINHHWTKSLIASADGRKLYVGVGSNSNVSENGMQNERDRAAILEIDPATGTRKVFASGLRNPVGIDWNPVTNQLWAVVNERDEIGDNAAPDYLTSVRPGGFYGWPWAYWGRHTDRRAWPPRPDMVARALKPDYGLGSHAGSLGLVFARGPQLGTGFAEGAFVGQHGSWNKSQPFGYRVIFVPFAGGQPSGPPREVLTGFLGQGGFYGRPVGVALDRGGALLVADDMGGAIWRVRAAAPAAKPQVAPTVAR